jgi:hypothetical protein
VTVARYRTPAGSDIDLRGIRPDRGCAPALVGAGAPRPASAPAGGGAGAPAPAPAPLAAAAALDGGDDAPDMDRCLLTALDLLANPGALPKGPAPNHNATLASLRD